MPTVVDETVVSTAYDTSGNGGRKIARYSDGINEYKIFAVKNGTTEIRLYKKLNNDAPVLLANFTVTTLTDVCIENAGNGYIGILYSHSGSTVSYRTVSVSLGTLGTIVNVDSGQSAVGNVTMISDDTKSNMYIGVPTKNSTYANSFNIRYTKGTINGDGTVTWGAVEQVTKPNVTGYDFKNPSIQLVNGIPVIVVDATLTFIGNGNAQQRNSISILKKDSTLFSHSSYLDSNWTSKAVYDTGGSTYAQSSPSAIFVPQSINGLANGRIWVAWHGLDATDTTRTNIRVAYSDDLGVNWTVMPKLTSGNVYAKAFASITANKNNNIYVVYEGTDSIHTTDNQVYKMVYNGTSWSAETTVTNITGSLGGTRSVSTLFDLSINFTEPLFIYKTSSNVLFSGTWTVTTISVTTGDIGQIQNENNILSYSITTDGTMSTITEKINGTVVNTRDTTSGQAVTLGLTQEQWDAIRFGKYADATGGKNTLTVEMGGEKWTYTFDKRLATDADIVSASKAVKDTNEVYLPAQLSLLSSGLSGKGSAPSANTFDEILNAIGSLSDSKSTSGITTSYSGTDVFKDQNGSNQTLSYVSIDTSVLGFVPDLIFLNRYDKTVTPPSYAQKDNFYTNGSYYANCMIGSSYFRVDMSTQIIKVPISWGNIQVEWKAVKTK